MDINIEKTKIELDEAHEKLEKCKELQFPDIEEGELLYNHYVTCYNRLISELVGIKQLPQKPLSSVTSATIGTSLGGVGVGVVAGVIANEKNNAYANAVKEFTSTQHGINRLIEELDYWHDLTYEYLYTHLYKRSFKQSTTRPPKNIDNDTCKDYRKKISDKYLKCVFDYFINRGDDSWLVAKNNFEQFKKEYQKNEDATIKKYQLLQSNFPKKRKFYLW